MERGKNIFLLFLFTGFTAFTYSGQVVKKEVARGVIRKTALIIMVAHKKVKEGKVYTGNLARAVAHQQFAIKLYRSGDFFRAIHQSKRARFLAIEAIKENKGVAMEEWKLSRDEEGSMSNAPTNEELDKNLEKEMPSAAALKDQEIIGTLPVVDLNSNE